MIVGQSMGAIAGLIAAGAFVVLVVFLCIFLTRMSAMLQETTRQITQLGNDADALGRELEDVLQNTNRLMDDLNDKAEKITPAVEAIANVSQSVSDLNDASRAMVDKFNNRREQSPFKNRVIKAAAQAAMMGALGRFGKRKKHEEE